MTATYIQRLADFVVNHDLQPTEASLQWVRYALFDTFGCLLIGASSEVASMTQAIYRSQAEKSQDVGARVFGTSLTLPLEAAAFLNATAAHALDMDDWEVPGNSHASAILIPSLIAAGADTELSGEEVTAAYIAGNEVIAVLGEAVNFDHYSRGWHATGTLASIGAAAAVAKLWNLSTTQTANALSIAVARAAGLTKQFGSHTKAMQAGFAAENALRAATLARHGLAGQMDVLEGRQGYLTLTGDFDPNKHARAFNRLGRRLAIDEYGIVLKPYPCCGYTHRLMDCARKLHDPRRTAKDIASIHLYLPDFHAAILPYRHPENLKQALFSLPFCTANALLTNNLTVQDLEDEVWKKRSIKDLISKSMVTAVERKNPTLNYDPQQPDRLEVKLNDGSVLKAAAAFPLGSPQKPMSERQLIEKFIENARRFKLPKNQDIQRLLEWQKQRNIHPLLEAIGI